MKEEKLGMVATLLCVVLLSLVSLEAANAQSSCYTAKFNWNNPLGTQNTIPTLQVVANPVLNPETSPVAKKCFESLANLEADLVRYVPWFPYPIVGLAEPLPPTATQTFWNFTYLESQFIPFMESTFNRGHRVIPNFSTQPAWMYDTSDYSYPSDPNVVDWGYPQGNALPNTTQLLVDYYSRLLSWIVKGEFVDELGHVHKSKYKFNITHYEIFNEPEGCHGLNVQSYTRQFDAIVKGVRQTLGPQYPIDFVGLALAGRELDWITYFLNESNHDPAALPITFFSFHFYAAPSSRNDINSYVEILQQAEGFVPVAQQIIQLRDKMSPHTKIDIDECGVISPNDNTQTVTAPPPLYWNAAGAMWAYLFSKLSTFGLDVLGESQLMGSPPIPQWHVPYAQYPSVSMLNWTTGEGNARYWVLKLIIENFGKTGTLKYVQSQVEPIIQTTICGRTYGPDYGNVSIICADPSAVIQQIEFAAFGTPNGQCGQYTHNSACDAKQVQSVVEKMCLGRHNCSVLSYPTFGDPCFGTVKNLAIQAKCSGAEGGYGVPAAGAGKMEPWVQGYIGDGGRTKKVLVVNRGLDTICVRGIGDETMQLRVEVVDELTGDGPARKETVKGGVVKLNRFAVAVVHLP